MLCTMKINTRNLTGRQHIRILLETKNLTMADLGRTVGISEALVSYCLSGKRRMSVENSLDIQQKHGIPAELWSDIWYESHPTKAANDCQAVLPADPGGNPRA